MSNSSNSPLTPAQIAALLFYGVGVGSEGGTGTGLGLAGWVVGGQGQFDSDGNAINAQSIIADSGYTVGTLQTDFGQDSPGFSAFFQAFEASPQGQAFSQAELNTIQASLQETGEAMAANSSLMLNETQFDAVNAFLQSSAGIAAANALDQGVINVTSPTGTAAANAVASTGGDLAAQEIAAAVAMKLYNQTGSGSTALSQFNAWLQNGGDSDGPITASSIQGWINQEGLTTPVSTGLSNTIATTNILDALEASSNPTLQAIYQDLVSNSADSPSTEESSDGLYDLGVRLLSVSEPVAASVMNAISSGTYYQGTSSSSINEDGTLATGSHGTIVGANGDIIIWNADGTAFVIQNGVSTQLSGISAIQVQGQQGQQFVAVNLPDGDSINLDTDPASVQCFVAGTPIEMADGSARRIEAIAIGDLVLAFDPRDPRGPLRSARVTRIFRNVTSEWLVLSNGLTVTPGHRFLNERGEFERVDALLARGGKLIDADGSAQEIAAERIIYSQHTRHLYEEAEELVAAASGALALAPQIARGWRTYNFEVEGLHTYVAGGLRVHNDSLGDLIVAEDDFQQVTGTVFDPTNPTDVQLLAQDIANGTIAGGALVSSIGADGDLTALEQRIVSDDDTITNITTNADGDTTFTDSYGDQIVLNPNREEVSESTSDGQGGTITQTFGYSSNGTQYVATEQDVSGSGQLLSNVVDTVNPTSGALLSSSETDYNNSGAEIDSFTTNANGDITTYDQYNPDGSQDFYVYNSAGEATSDTQYSADGAVVEQQQFAYDSSGDLASITTDDAAGDLVSYDAYNPDGSHLLIDYNASGEVRAALRSSSLKKVREPFQRDRSLPREIMRAAA